MQYVLCRLSNLHGNLFWIICSGFINQGDWERAWKINLKHLRTLLNKPGFWKFTRCSPCPQSLFGILFVRILPPILHSTTFHTIRNFFDHSQIFDSVSSCLQDKLVKQHQPHQGLLGFRLASTQTGWSLGPFGTGKTQDSLFYIRTPTSMLLQVSECLQLVTLS